MCKRGASLRRMRTRRRPIDTFARRGRHRGPAGRRSGRRHVRWVRGEHLGLLGTPGPTPLPALGASPPPPRPPGRGPATLDLGVVTTERGAHLVRGRTRTGERTDGRPDRIRRQRPQDQRIDLVFNDDAARTAPAPHVGRDRRSDHVAEVGEAGAGTADHAGATDEQDLQGRAPWISRLRMDPRSRDPRTLGGGSRDLSSAAGRPERGRGRPPGSRQPRGPGGRLAAD